MKKQNYRLNRNHKKKQKLAWFKMLEEIKKLTGKGSAKPRKSTGNQN